MQKFKTIQLSQYLYGYVIPQTIYTVTFNTAKLLLNVGDTSSFILNRFHFKILGETATCGRKSLGVPKNAN